MKPSEVTKANENKVWDTLYGNDVEKRLRFKSECTEKSSKIGKSWPQLKT